LTSLTGKPGRSAGTLFAVANLMQTHFFGNLCRTARRTVPVICALTIGCAGIDASDSIDSGARKTDPMAAGSFPPSETGLQGPTTPATPPYDTDAAEPDADVGPGIHDAPRDARDAHPDVGCSCSEADAEYGLRYTSFECFHWYADGASTYETSLADALASCRLGRPSSGLDAFVTIVYQGCGLLGISYFGLDSNRPTRIFDATTLEFVGLIVDPYPNPQQPDPCNQHPYWDAPIAAGVLPSNSCVPSYTVVSCGPEAGTTPEPDRDARSD